MELKRDTISRELAELRCERCQHVGARVETVFQQGPPHFAKALCENCGRFIDWIGWPPEPEAGKQRRRRHIKTVADRCELCLRSKTELPEPEKIDWHHVIEHSAGGDPDPRNLRPYCTACHSMVNWIRTYFGHYHPDDQ